jgi:8-oxo-dGTP pyrophosphatase MutT (NUDIX family)
MQRTRASGVCLHGGALLCVRLRDPVTRVARLFVPGGGLDAGESPAAAAEREALEETGYRVRVDPATQHIARYPFVWAGIEVDCTTHFFRAALIDPALPPEPTHDAFYNEGALWLPLARVEAEFGFHAAILAAIQHVIAGG